MQTAKSNTFSKHMCYSSEPKNNGYIDEGHVRRCYNNINDYIFNLNDTDIDLHTYYTHKTLKNKVVKTVEADIIVT